MRIIIHDLNNENLNKISFTNDDIIIDANNCKNSCVGCFSCWIKHPKKCIYNDDYSNLTELISKCDDLVLISKSRYGCYSSGVKRVLERCIGYVLPYFTIRNGEIHHKNRYSKDLKLCSYFYGNIDEADKKVMDDLVKANAVNLNVTSFKVNFANDIEELINAYTD